MKEMLQIPDLVIYSYFYQHNLHHKVEYGKSFITTAGNLKAKYLIHLSIPLWAGVRFFR